MSLHKLCLLTLTVTPAGSTTAETLKYESRNTRCQRRTHDHTILHSRRMARPGTPDRDEQAERLTAER